MSLLGNDRVNQIYEARLEASKGTKPGPTSDRAAKESFIHQKYVAKAFVCPEQVMMDESVKNEASAVK